MKAATISEDLGSDTISKKGDVYTVRWGFYYTSGKKAQDFADRVKRMYPHATIVDKGEVWKSFRASASIANQSHWFVKFTLNAPTPVTA